MPSSIQPEVQKYLEAVYAVAPFPEEYVRYRLHLATALQLPLIDAWFEERRQADKEGRKRDITLADHSAVDGVEVLAQARKEEEHPRSTHFQLFAPAAQRPAFQDSEMESLSTRQATDEVVDVGRALTMMQRSFSREPADWAKNSTRPFNPLHKQAPGAARDESMERETAEGNGVAKGSHANGHKNSRSSNAQVPSPTRPGSRFTEVDLDVISGLVGLETISSTQEHCGSHSLYMFEQLTALDSLDPEGGSGNKRRRTRHQHFWRNTDKLDPEERVYVPTSSIKPALKKSEPVEPKLDISADERTNAWTVCLTTRGVVSYLNKRISPLGVRVIRALQDGKVPVDPRRPGQPVQWGPARGSLPNGRALADEAVDEVAGVTARTRQARPTYATPEDFSWNAREDPPYQPNGNAGRTSSSHGSEDDEEYEPFQKRSKQRQQQLEAANTLAQSRDSFQESGFEPIPRARKRKPG